MYSEANYSFSEIQVGPDEDSSSWVVSGGYLFALLVPLIFAYMHPNHGTHVTAILILSTYTNIFHIITLYRCQNYIRDVQWEKKWPPLSSKLKFVREQYGKCNEAYL